MAHVGRDLSDKVGDVRIRDGFTQSADDDLQKRAGELGVVLSRRVKSMGQGRDANFSQLQLVLVRIGIESPELYLDSLVERASGLFVWCSTLFKYLDESRAAKADADDGRVTGSWRCEEKDEPSVHWPDDSTPPQKKTSLAPISSPL